MLTLAVDTSAVTATAVLADGDALIAQTSVDGAKTHSETLLPAVVQMMESAHILPQDIELYACTVGPGSFTGIRIGVSAVKGLAFGRGKPCVALCSVDVLAENLRGVPDILVCPVMDARRNTFYNALYRNGEKLCDIRLISGEELCAELARRGERVCFVGDGTHALTRAMQGSEFVIPTPEVLVRPSGFAAALCAQRMYDEGVGVCTDTALKPFYLRPTQAERERLAALEGGEA